ncbi:MAG: glycosyltransferase family 9 protein [Chthoniobacterales bacterium]
MTLLEPALARLAEAHDSPVHLLTRSGHAPLISLMENVRQVSRVWLRRYAAVYCYDHLDKSALHAISTFSPDKELLLRSPTEVTKLHRIAFDEIRAPGIGDSFLAEYNWRYTLANARSAYRPPRLLQTPADWKPADEPSGDYLLLNSTAGWKSKRWKSSAWAEVLRGLLDHGVPRILVTSGNQDWQVEHAHRITDTVADPRVTGLAGQTKLEEFLHLVAHARMVLGVDGAASHLANAFGGRSLTLFFRTNPHNWHATTPTSRAILAHHDEEADTYEISTDEVLRNATDLWEG